MTISEQNIQPLDNAQPTTAQENTQRRFFYVNYFFACKKSRILPKVVIYLPVRTNSIYLVIKQQYNARKTRII